MVMDALAGLLLLLSGALAGVLLAVEVAVVPMMGALSGDRYVQVHRLLDPRFDPLMPAVARVAMGTGLLLTVFAPGSGARAAFAGTEAGLIGVALVSELSNVRINRCIDAWDTDRLPQTWSSTRDRWARSNRHRTLIAVAAFAAAITGTALM
jgi:uncharacterized membrane protein